jgi:hypothetical protein
MRLSKKTPPCYIAEGHNLPLFLVPYSVPSPINVVDFYVKALYWPAWILTQNMPFSLFNV